MGCVASLVLLHCCTRRGAILCLFTACTSAGPSVVATPAKDTGQPVATEVGEHMAHDDNQESVVAPLRADGILLFCRHSHHGHKMPCTREQLPATARPGQAPRLHSADKQTH